MSRVFRPGIPALDSRQLGRSFTAHRLCWHLVHVHRRMGEVTERLFGPGVPCWSAPDGEIMIQTLHDNCVHFHRSQLASSVSHLWAVLLAGGDGFRLRDLMQRIAGDSRPKQFCRIPEAVLAISRAMADSMLDVAYQLLDTLDFSRDVLANLPHRLLVLRDRTSGWADLGSPARVLDPLSRNGIQPEWASEGDCVLDHQ